MWTTRRQFLGLLGRAVASGVALGPLAGCRSSRPGPNVVFIMADDLGWGGLGCFGAERIPTPHCDRLAAEGMRFTDAHSGASVCTPTRYGVLTGRYAWRTWLKNWVVREHMPLLIEPGRLTVASMLQQHGYATGCLGKWHLGWGDELHPDWNRELPRGPLDVGFDYFFGVPYSHESSPELQVFVENRRILGLPPGGDIRDPATAKRVRRNLAYTAVGISSAAVRFIERNAERPFFLYYPSTDIHTPHTPHPRFRGRTRLGDYGDSVVEFDWAVGEVLGALDRLDLAQDTLVIVTSDNGAWLGPGWTLEGHAPNGPWRGGKATIYEGGHRVPFLARWPGVVPAGAVSREIICLNDLMATCAAIVGHALPADAGEDSYDLLPALRTPRLDRPIREATVHHSVSGMFAIRMGRWKLIEGLGDGFLPVDWERAEASGRDRPVRDPATGRFQDLVYDWPPPPEPQPGEPQGQLYDLHADPGETKNVWKQHPEVVARLTALLERYRSQPRSRA